jgi:aminoglycoside 6'-N-acetyltransferase I
MIIDLDPNNQTHIDQAANLLIEGFALFSPTSWRTFAEAIEEVHEALEAEKICRVALNDEDVVLGWVGGIPGYRGRVWELHPLVVAPQRQRQGIGRALIQDLEEQVRRRGGLTLILGTDDEVGQTSLSGVDLYPDVASHIGAIRNLHGHPYEFYQKCGFVIYGLLPDANGFGKPDILMAKRVQRA